MPDARFSRKSRVLDGVLTVVLCFAILLLAGVFTAKILGYRTLVVRSGSMTPTFGVGDVVVTRSVPARTVRAGDIVTFRDPALRDQLVTHRVVSVQAQGATLAFVTKGDANASPEHWRISARGTLGNEVLVIPALGRALHDAIPIGLSIAILAVIGWLLVAALRKIWSDRSPPRATRRWRSRGALALILATFFFVAGGTATAAAWIASLENTNTFTASTTFATISSVALQNKTGGTAGLIEKGDQIIVTFSKTMKVASFCSAWSGDSNNQSLSGNGNVTVTVTNGNGATNDSITVTANTCTFNFGSIDLGSNGYVTGSNATFSGNGANDSTIAWTAATHVLTITLGSASGGTLNTVASSTAVYTASSSITSTAGGIITNSPYTLATGKYF